ncbi:hypothetical protein VTL71DRAFT_10502 [Oculimacula yallundae]|uniref:Uncharacterized protein n=1 Tax=Oculimacula yallundae TaxID=86028 RepID=A0ABR4CUX7_9HELO
MTNLVLRRTNSHLRIHQSSTPKPISISIPIPHLTSSRLYPAQRHTNPQHSSPTLALLSRPPVCDQLTHPAPDRYPSFRNISITSHTYMNTQDTHPTSSSLHTAHPPSPPSPPTTHHLSAPQHSIFTNHQSICNMLDRVQRQCTRCMEFQCPNVLSSKTQRADIPNHSSIHSHTPNQLTPYCPVCPRGMHTINYAELPVERS